MKSYKIHLIRNAACEGAGEGRYIGVTDFSLSEEGRAEAGQMAADYGYPYADTVFTSPLKRCTETAEILYPYKKAVGIDGLRECNFGIFENKTADEMKDNEVFAGWIAGKNPPPDGESSPEFGKRICETFEKIAEGMMKSGVKETAIITHGGVISIILAAYGIPQAPMHEWMCPDCCGYTILLDPAMWMRSKKVEVFEQIPNM
ncbi:MAG: histidine phosphatase family protein [Clostridia bacterium]|nr:histidine phosphatase family protein [Clostridia bacterium]